MSKTLFCTNETAKQDANRRDPDSLGAPNASGSVCRRCGRPPRDGDNRCACGGYVPGHALSCETQFMPGNFAAATHLQRTDRLPQEFAFLDGAIEEFRNASIADDGGESEVPTRRRSLHEYRARLHRRILALDAALEQRGMLDRRGKLRVAWLQQLASLIDRARALDVTLGLARRAKRVPTLDDYLADVADEAGQEATDGAIAEFADAEGAATVDRPFQTEPAPRVGGSDVDGKGGAS